jgi:hypothetical protein
MGFWDSICWNDPIPDVSAWCSVINKFPLNCLKWGWISQNLPPGPVPSHWHVQGLRGRHLWRAPALRGAGDPRSSAGEPELCVAGAGPSASAFSSETVVGQVVSGFVGPTLGCLGFGFLKFLVMFFFIFLFHPICNIGSTWFDDLHYCSWSIFALLDTFGAFTWSSTFLFSLSDRSNNPFVI